MGTKNNPGKFDCYAAAEPDEPMFVLLGRDVHAAALVEEWAHKRMASAEPIEKVEEAYACAKEMRAWCEGLGKKPVQLAKPKWVVLAGGEVSYSVLCHTDEQMEAAYIHAQSPDEKISPEDGPPSDFVLECQDYLRHFDHWRLDQESQRSSLTVNFEDGSIEIRRL